MHFGIYLRRKGIVSSEQFVAALETQFEQLVPIGQLALEEGILSARDIFAILSAQQNAPLDRFGEIAIELGLMTADELMRLLMIQSDRKRPLTDILIEQGTLDEKSAAAELLAYRTQLLRPATRVRTILLPRRKAPPRVVTPGPPERGTAMHTILSN